MATTTGPKKTPRPMNAREAKQQGFTWVYAKISEPDGGTHEVRGAFTPEEAQALYAKLTGR